jgi:hypothetical protein
MLDMIGKDVSRSQYKEPDQVAEAALEFLTAQAPKRRYMVTPNRGEAEVTIRGILTEMAQLNQGHRHSFSRDQLVEMLDDALQQTAGSAVAGAAPAPTGPGLIEAAVQGDVAAVRRHIAAGADLDAREPMAGSTPLIAATTFGRTDAAKALIEAGAQLDAQNRDGSTALITGALLARTEIVRALLDAGADRSLRNNSGATALDVAMVPFQDIRGVYDYLLTILGPAGLTLDYDRLRADRPAIAEMLR